MHPLRFNWGFGAGVRRRGLVTGSPHGAGTQDAVPADSLARVIVGVARVSPPLYVRALRGESQPVVACVEGVNGPANQLLSRVAPCFCFQTCNHTPATRGLRDSKIDDTKYRSRRRRSTPSTSAAEPPAAAPHLTHLPHPLAMPPLPAAPPRAAATPSAAQRLTAAPRLLCLGYVWARIQL